MAPVTLGQPSMRRAAVAAVRFHAEPDATSRAAKLGWPAAASGRTTTEMPAPAEAFRNARRSNAPAIAISMRRRLNRFTLTHGEQRCEWLSRLLRQLKLGSRQQAFFIAHDQHRHRHDDRSPLTKPRTTAAGVATRGERLTEGIGTQAIAHDPDDGRRVLAKKNLCRGIRSRRRGWRPCCGETAGSERRRRTCPRVA